MVVFIAFDMIQDNLIATEWYYFQWYKNVKCENVKRHTFQPKLKLWLGWRMLFCNAYDSAVSVGQSRLKACGIIQYMTSQRKTFIFFLLLVTIRHKLWKHIVYHYCEINPLTYCIHRNDDFFVRCLLTSINKVFGCGMMMMTTMWLVLDIAH